MTLVPDSDAPERFAPGAQFVTDHGEVLVVTSVAPYRDRGLVVGFEGYQDRPSAESLRGHVVTIDPEERRELDDGEFWPDELIGLQVVAEDGELLGRVADVEIAMGQDRLVVATVSGNDVLVPFVDELVDDPAGGRIVVRPPEGLFD